MTTLPDHAAVRPEGVPALLQAILDTGERLRAALAEGDVDAASRLAAERGALVAELGAPHVPALPVELRPLALQIRDQHAVLADAAQAVQDKLAAEHQQMSRFTRAAGRYTAAAPTSRLDAAG